MFMLYFLAIVQIVLCENIMCINKRENLVDWTQTFEHHCIYIYIMEAFLGHPLLSITCNV